MADVLLVTDAEWIARQCAASLCGEHSLHHLWRGDQTLAAITEMDPDLVLLDMQVGNMGGVAVCLAIRQEEEMGRLGTRPVLMLLDRAVDEFLARRSGADAWLLKPIDPLRLARVVRESLADVSSPQIAAANSSEGASSHGV